MILNFLRRKIINLACDVLNIKGWSGKEHWKLFQEVFSRKKKFKELAILGVYHGKDLSYICSSLKKNNVKDFKIYAVDLFENVAMADWGPENQHLNWNDIKIEPPSLKKAKSIIKLLGFSKNVIFIKGDFKKLADYKPKLDFFYIDLSHDYKTTCDAIELCVKFSDDETIMMGDDYGDGGFLGQRWEVKKAVSDKFKDFKIHYNLFWESNKKNLKIIPTKKDKLKNFTY